MSGNAQKTPIFETVNRFSEKKINDAFQLTGKALPCSVVAVQGSIVTVKFELNTSFTLPNVTIPMFGPIYIRYPIQVGDKGIVIPADARLSGVSGIGGGIADLSQPANLTALVFLPISNTAWSEVDPQSLTMYGPGGVVLRDTNSNSSIVLTESGILAIGRDTMSITSGTSSMIVNNDGSFSISGSGSGTISAGDGITISDASHSTNLSMMNSVFASLITWLNSHTHTNSAGTTTPPDIPYTGGNIVS